ncbi:hypothetical protein GCM10020331_079420 [Ectobacillus funiculus]
MIENEKKHAQMLKKGAYVVAGAEQDLPQVQLIATGSEVALAIGVKDALAKRGD